MIILTSNGLTSDSIKEAFLNTKSKNAGIIVTADPEYRNRNRQAVRIRDDFLTLGFSVDFLDLDYDDITNLLNYDIVFFIGGNPFYLLNSLREKKGRDILRLLEREKVVSGASAGSMVLGQSIALINEFEPQMNDLVRISLFNGINITDVNICPHYSRFLTHYQDFEKRVKSVEMRNKINITRINDGEAIVIDKGLGVRI